MFNTVKLQKQVNVLQAENTGLKKQVDLLEQTVEHLHEVIEKKNKMMLLNYEKIMNGGFQ